ncbi:hypothetical protein ACTXT7_002866 [Hymenolepis weldensis]
MLRTAALFCLILSLYPSNALIPQPVSFYVYHQFYLLPYHIDYDHNGPYCFTLHAAIRRLLESFSNQHLVRDLPTSFNGNITLLKIKLSTPCNEINGPVYPNENSKEEFFGIYITFNLNFAK